MSFFGAAACGSGDIASGGSSSSGGAGGGGGAGGTGSASVTGGASGTVGSTGGSSVGNGADGSDVASTSDGASGDGSDASVARKHGKSQGCSMTAAMAGNQSLSLPKCTGCSAAMGNCPRDCIAPEFAPRVAANQDFTTRSFSVQLPSGYDANTAYPIFMGGGGCGSGGGGLGLPGDAGAIRVNLSIKNGGPLDGSCFADGGQACSGDTTHLAWCVNSPEMAYVRGVLNWIEARYCVDQDKEFIGGASSGAWEAYTLGCGDADQLRGFVAIAGGKREHRWPCTGPVAAFMIADTADDQNPIVVNTVEPHLDSHGSSAARDELLVRNGCQGTTGTVYDPQYPACIKYNCPAAYPVVWCALNGGHTNTSQGGVNYAQAVWPFFMSLPPP
ncbi:MAG TPA: hypothetical protein VH374_02890 [Polyangia bacterium]|nr:hypothetical protein [Polyangia bacterium]